MKDNWKIHRYAENLEWRIKGIRSARHCSKANVQYLLDFHDYLFAEGLSIPRVAKYLRLICKIDSRMSGKDFKKVEKQDVLTFLTWLEKSEYSEWTKSDYKIGLKKFFKWLYDDKMPGFVSWIKSSPKNIKRMLPQEILTPDEIVKMIECAKNNRDKALISSLYESGCRIGELMTLKLKNVTFDKYGVIFIVNGKTGVRRVRLISSANLIGIWLNEHKGRKNNNNYLWCRLRHPDEMLSYNSFKKILQVAAKTAGINKRVNPHSFRHARATHMANKLTEAQMKEYFGWVQASKMASVYVHLSGRDVDKAVLAYYGIEKVEEEPDAMKPITCCCGEHNSPVNNYCNKCGKPLKTETALGLDKEKTKAKDVMNYLFKHPELLDKLKEMVIQQ